MLAKRAPETDLSTQSQIQHLEEKVRVLTEKLLESFDELNILYDVTKSLADVYNTSDITKVALIQIQEVVHPEKAAISLVERDREYVVVTAGYGLPNYWTGRKLEAKGTVYEEVIKSRKPLLTDNGAAQQNSAPQGVSSLSEYFPLYPACLIPMTVNEEVIGIISLAGKEDKQAYTARDVKLLVTVGTQMAMAIQNERLISNLKNSFLVTVRSLSAAIDAKDAYTYGHSERVSTYAMAIGQALGLPQAEMEQLELASLLHDVGKIGIPESILNKPGKLSPQEMEVVRLHPLKGVEILKSARQMDSILAAVRNHHERYDGHGYPDGLSHEQIPLLSRIIAVADSYDAMTSNRPYRPKRSKAAAAEEIKKESGSMYDPKVIWAFAKWINREKSYVI